MPPDRVLVRAPNWLGDAVMALPAIGDLRRHFSSAVLAVAAPAPISVLFEEADGVDEVIATPPAGRVGLRGAEARAIEAGRFDVAILLPNSFGSALAARQAHVPERWGYRADWRRPLLTRAVARPKGARHQAEYYQELVCGLGIERGPCEPRLEASAQALDEGRQALSSAGWNGASPIVAFAPGAAYGGAKRWPTDRVAEVIDRVTRESAAMCVLVGSAADRRVCSEVEDAVRSRTPDATPGNLTGRTDLRALIGVLAACRALVTNDSGAMHLAAAIGVPVIAIFGPTDERMTAPKPRHATAPPADILTAEAFCRPCLLRECPIDHRCMRGVSAAAVADRVRRASAAAS